MSSGIYLVENEDLIEMTEEPYDSEDLLQTLLEISVSVCQCGSTIGDEE